MKYTREHVCIRKKGKKYYVGLSEQYLSELDRILHVTITSADETFEGEQLCCIDTESSYYEFNFPLSGTIVEVNEELQNEPDLIRDEEDGWVCVLKDIDEESYDEMLSHDKYRHFLEDEGLI